jgi:uncharacterized protein (TIGR02118 family)
VIIAALGRDPDAALDLGRRLAADPGVRACTVHVALEPADAAFATLLRVEGADPEAAALPGVGGIGRYRIEERHVKARPLTWPAGSASPGVAAVYGVRRHPSLDRAGYDAHWRDVHAPLALRHHVGMDDYWQCAIIESLRPEGPDYDGIAIVQFPSQQAFEEQFFDSRAGRDVIVADASSFTDLAGSDRVLMTEYVLSRP